MSQTYTITISEPKAILTAAEGTSIMDALKSAGIFLDAPCAGQGICGKCLVSIQTASGVWEQVRACQTKLFSDLELKLDGQAKDHKILTSSHLRQVPFSPPRKASQEGLYLASLDIGTTTIAAYLLDKKTGEELACASMLNPQAAYGADVISRANYVLEHGYEELTGGVRRAVSQLLKKLADKRGISTEEIGLVCLVGNTCMQHIFFQYPMESLVRSPYQPYKRELVREKAARFGISIHPEGELVFLPVIAGFVGADTIGCLLALRPDLNEEISLIIDIGTNGELVLGNKDRLVCCSTAAGPAFEGAKIECGMRGAQGAIDHVFLKEDLQDPDPISFSVIGGGGPKGLCGSGLIDTVACLRKAGLIDETGRLLAKEEAARLSPSLGEHITEIGGKPAFLYSLRQPCVYLTQKDIREVQLAKGAISAGILLLEKRLGITHQQIRQVFAAGAFGNYMDPKSACVIGLLPSVLLDRIVPVGNAAGEGAKLALQNKEELEQTKLLMDQVEFLELASVPEFQDCFIDELEFPPLGDPENSPSEIGQKA